MAIRITATAFSILSQDVVVLVGQGNVAIDVVRILAKTLDELKHTDIAAHALELLSESKIREIHVIGRRGPAQAKFTPQELQELGTLSDCYPYVDPNDLNLNAESNFEVSDKMSRHLAKNMEILLRFSSLTGLKKSRRCHFHFLQSPKAILGRTRVEGIRLCKNRLSGQPFNQVAEETDELVDLKCGLVFRSVGKLSGTCYR